MTRISRLFGVEDATEAWPAEKKEKPRGRRSGAFLISDRREEVPAVYP